MTDLDRIDRKILDSLQRNGRISNADLAEQIGLSASACSERVRRLERACHHRLPRPRGASGGRAHAAGVRRDQAFGQVR